MKKIYLLLIVILMFFVSGCQTQSAKEKVGISIDNVTMSSEKEELIINEIKKDALIRNQLEQEGFLEKYKETTIKVKENKYKQFVNTKKEQKEFVICYGDDGTYLFNYFPCSSIRRRRRRSN